MRLPALSVLILAMALPACGSRDREVTLTRFKDTGAGPNEFTIMPGKPLQSPEDYAALPAPTPGGPNLTDQNPLADGVAALGGNPAALNVGPVSARDTALVSHAGRFGVNPGIRQVLASEDVEVRRRYGRVNILNIGPNDDYNLAYRRQWLNSQAEAQRLRSLGIATPASPPPAE
ncbi:MAG: DUF3035 domain-containing protein [Rhodobacteraceae bacterium]|nr:DUF3035 domain-containing protein [Paracoccaceae bacterium]